MTARRSTSQNSGERVELSHTGDVALQTASDDARMNGIVALVFAYFWVVSVALAVRPGRR